MVDDGVGASGLLPVDTDLHGRYRIIRVIGRGGMSAVYEAEHSGLGKRVAIKEMLAPAAKGPEGDEAIGRFQNEARTLARLEHRYFPRVTDFFSQGGRYYLVMEYVAGETLDDLVKKTAGFLSEDAVLRWASQLCDVLSYLHSQSPPVVFRDLKPSNVMVDEGGQVKLIDFGIARFFKPGKQSDTSSMGTAGYSAPEQYGTGQTDARSDIYSLGAVLHYLLTRRDPTASPFNFPPVREINPKIRASTERVVSRCLSMRAEDRFSSAAEVKKALLAGSGEPETTFLAPRMRPAPEPAAVPAAFAPAVPMANSTSSEGFPWAVLLVVFLTMVVAGVGAYFVFIDRLPGDVQVPAVTQQDQKQAEAALSAVHLKVSIQGYEASSLPVGAVDRQEPAAGAVAPSGQAVSLWLSSGPGLVLVPDVTQMSEDQAKKQIKATGLRVGTVRSDFSDTTPKGYVIQSEPEANFKSAQDQPVALVISKGPKPPPPPPTGPGETTDGSVVPTSPNQPNFDVRVPVLTGGTHAVKVTVQQGDGSLATAFDEQATGHVKVTVEAPNPQSIRATVDGKSVVAQIDPVTPGAGSPGVNSAPAAPSTP